MDNQRGLNNYLVEYNVNCYYDETRMFSRFAAVYTPIDNLIPGISECFIRGLVQIMINNIDKKISSQNCHMLWNYMATLAIPYTADLNRLGEILNPHGKWRHEEQNEMYSNTARTCYTGSKKLGMALVNTFVQEVAA